MKLLLLLLTTLLLTSCDNFPDENDPIQLRPSYFPLEIGNYWKFESPATEPNHLIISNETISVVKDTTINNTDYFVVERQMEDNNPSVLFLREDRYNRIVRLLEDGSEWIWFDQYASPETSYLYPFSVKEKENYNVNVYNEKDIVTPSGTYPEGMKFYFDVHQIADEEHGYILVENIGPIVNFGAWAYNTELVEYSVK